MGGKKSKEYYREYYLKNKERMNINMKINYLNKREHRLLVGKKYYQENKGNISKKHKEWRDNNKDKYLLYNRERNKVYREKNRERLIENKKQKYQQNKSLHWEDQLKRKYGITANRYFEMLEKQNYICAICEQPEKYKNRKLAVDHCHKTKIVRGLLCFRCNATIGQFNDDISLFNKAIKYLNNNK